MTTEDGLKYKLVLYLAKDKMYQIMDRNRNQVNLQNRYMSFRFIDTGSDNEIVLQIEGLTYTIHYDDLFEELLDAHIEYTKNRVPVQDKVVRVDRK